MEEKGVDNLDGNKSENVKDTLQKLDVHQKWIGQYRNPENDHFYELVTEKIIRAFDAPPESLVFDAGCGDCRHSIRLAKRGFRCHAADFSPEILKKAEINVREQGLQGRITIGCEDITGLSFESNSFEYIFCWGVLMHIPDLEKAVAELCRVLKPGGRIIISENNMHSLEELMVYTAKKLMRTKTRITTTPAGTEYLIPTSAGPIFARGANIGYLQDILRKNNVIVRQRWPGHFTSIYTKLPHPLLRKPVHVWNRLWFHYNLLPQLAVGNILFGEKQRLR